MTLNERNILQNAGKISKELADERALLEYDKFRAVQRVTLEHESDFDRAVIQIEKPKRMAARKKLKKN